MPDVSPAAPTGGPSRQIYTPTAQLRLAYWDAVDISRPDKALWRELLDRFFHGDGIARGVAWELWSYADHRNGMVPDFVTPLVIADSTGWSAKKSVRPALAALVSKGIAQRTRPPNRRRAYRYQLNLGGLFSRRRSRSRRKPAVDAPHGGNETLFVAPHGGNETLFVAPHGGIYRRDPEGEIWYPTAAANPSRTRDRDQQQREEHAVRAILADTARMFRLAGEAGQFDAEKELRNWQNGDATRADLQRYHDEIASHPLVKRGRR